MAGCMNQRDIFIPSLAGTPYKYGVYLAACPQDGEIAVDIKTYLEEKGLQVCTDPGNTQETEIKISQSRKMVLLVSRNYFAWGPSSLELTHAKEKVELLDLGDVILVLLPKFAWKDLEDHKLNSYYKIHYNDQDFKEYLLNHVADYGRESWDCLTNIGIGMAFSHYYGYLRLILPNIENRLLKSGHMEGASNPNKRNMSKKFFIIIPASLKGLASFSQMSPCIKNDANIIFEAGRGGNQERDYSTSVHCIEDAEKMYKFMGDIPNILINLYDMQRDVKGFPITPAQKRMAIQQFYRYLKFLLDGDAECYGKYAFIYHDDELTTGYQPIADMILSAIQQEIMQDLTEDQDDTGNEKKTHREMETFCERDNKYIRVRHPMSFYEMTIREKSHALIINNRQFRDEANQTQRPGSEQDEDRVEKLLKDLGYEVRVYRDQSADQIRSQMQHYQYSDMHTYAESFVCVIMSHGEDGQLIGTCGGKVNFADLANGFGHCNTLRGKPKMFFVEACQTGSRDSGSGDHVASPATAESAASAVSNVPMETVASSESAVPMETASPSESAVPMSTASPPESPILADRNAIGRYKSLLAPSIADTAASFATVPGHVAYRDPNTGALYIQALCNQIEKHARSKCLVDILQSVTKEVSEDLEERIRRNSNMEVDEMSHQYPTRVQIPCFFSTMDKDVCFGELYKKSD